MTRAIRRFLAGRRLRKFDGYRIAHNSDRLFVYGDVGKNSQLVGEVKWSEVNGVFAFKRHLYTEDQICLEFQASDGPTLTITEDEEGWNDLRDNLDSLLPGCRPYDDWFREVAFPAFETNLTQIYARSAADDDLPAES